VELKLVVDLPRVVTIHLPSAVITTLSCGIFRWVENGCRTEAKFSEEDLEGYEAMLAAKDTAIEHGMAMFSTIDELCALVD
jgi:hypothetical protein